MDSTLIGLIPYGPVGLAFISLLYYLNQTHQDLRKERQNRIEDAQKSLDTILALQERILVATERLSAATELIMKRSDLK